MVFPMMEKQALFPDTASTSQTSSILSPHECWRGASQTDLLCLQLIFYTVVQTLYTLGHSLSLIALITGSAILCLFR